MYHVADHRTTLGAIRNDKLISRLIFFFNLTGVFEVQTQDTLWVLGSHIILGSIYESQRQQSGAGPRYITNAFQHGQNCRFFTTAIFSNFHWFFKSRSTALSVLHTAPCHEGSGGKPVAPCTITNDTNAHARVGHDLGQYVISGYQCTDQKLRSQTRQPRKLTQSSCTQT